MRVFEMSSWESSLTASGDGVAAARQASAQRPAVCVGAGVTFSDLLIDLCLGHVRLLLGLGIRVLLGGGTHNGARGGTDHQTGAGVARPADNGAENTACDRTGRGPGTRRYRGLHHDTLVGVRGRQAGVHPGLLHGPLMTLVAVAVGLLRRL